MWKSLPRDTLPQLLLRLSSAGTHLIALERPLRRRSLADAALPGRVPLVGFVPGCALFESHCGRLLRSRRRPGV